VLGIVGALGLVRGIDDSLASLRVSGQVFDVFIYQSDEHSSSDLLEIANAEPKAGATATMGRRPLDVGGEGVPVYSLAPGKGRAEFVVLSGDAPRGRDEVAVAPSTLAALRKDIGDAVDISGERFRIVGTTLLPQTAHSSFDQGAWVAPGGMQRLPGDEAGDEVVAQATPGVSPEELGEALQARADGELDAETASPPQDVVLLRNVRTLPRVLAAFLGLLGVAALGHALVTSVRRRRHDLAVLRAMGFRPAQNAATIAWQATVIAVVGLLIGLPLGIAAGRISWRWVADSTPLLYVAPLAGLAVLLAIPGSVAIANALAALPARRAARLRPVEVLRTE
jgi:predicted lysophospholipase L1 biosynthesis ABC-type transport system permease subunit